MKRKVSLFAWQILRLSQCLGANDYESYSSMYDARKIINLNEFYETVYNRVTYEPMLKQLFVLAFIWMAFFNAVPLFCQPAFPTVCDTIHFKKGANWTCFPVIDRSTSDSEQAASLLTDIMHPVKPSLYLLETENPAGKIYWNYNNWVNESQIMYSTAGYRIHLTRAADLEICGSLIDEYTEISLHEGVNWIGYFLEDSMKPLDAFAPVLDAISGIKTESFALEKIGTDWVGPQQFTLNYGEMVIVRASQPCTFSWCQDGKSGSPACHRPVSTLQEYEAKYDYIPVFLKLSEEHYQQDAEVGIWVNGVCRGAEVVTDSVMMIRAYESWDVLSSRESEISFKHICHGQNAVITMPALFCFSEKKCIFAGFQEEHSTEDTKKKPAAVCFSAVGTSQIELTYSLPQDGPVCVKVFNSRGQLVTTLLDGEQPSGLYTVTWKGADSAGNAVSSGIYFYRVTAGNSSINRKMVLLK
jgi:hypothetical protein